MKISKIIHKNSITLVRALLALSMLLTLLFTPFVDLFPPYHLQKINANVEGLMYLNYFLWFNNPFIPYLISIIILIVTILGLFPRYLCLLHSWAAYSIFYSMLIVEGGDQINVILTLLIIPICLLDSRKNGWKNIKKAKLYNKDSIYVLNARYAILSIKIQMAVLYLNAGISKIFAKEWSNGTAVYYWFYDNMFGAPTWIRTSIGFLFKNDLTVSIINWGVIFLEISLFVALFIKLKDKYKLFIAGVIFHFLIILIHGLPTFFLAMSAGLILYLLRLDQNISKNYKNLKNAFLKLQKNVETI